MKTAYTKAAKVSNSTRALKSFGVVSFAIVVCFVFAVVSAAAATSEIADAAQRGDTNAVRTLVAQRADVNAAQADGATALHWAVYRSDRALVDLLIRAGANVKAANRAGVTPLWLASVNGDAAVIETLLTAGADPNEALPLGETAAHDCGAHRTRGRDEGPAGPWCGCERARDTSGNDGVDVGGR